jgi:hypothetical protein
VNERFGDIADAERAAEEGAARFGRRNQFLGMPEMLGLVGGMAHGGSTSGLATALALHFAKTRGASTVADAALTGSKLIAPLADPAARALTRALPLALSQSGVFATDALEDLAR